MRSFARQIPRTPLRLFVMLAVPLAVVGRTGEFTILGHQKIRAAVNQGGATSEVIAVFKRSVAAR